MAAFSFLMCFHSLSIAIRIAHVWSKLWAVIRFYGAFLVFSTLISGTEASHSGSCLLFLWFNQAPRVVLFTQTPKSLFSLSGFHWMVLSMDYIIFSLDFWFINFWVLWKRSRKWYFSIQSGERHYNKCSSFDLVHHWLGI